MGFLRMISTLLLIYPILAYAQDDKEYEYERSSLHTMMIKHLNQKFEDVIENIYLKTPFPERFNEHNLGVRIVAFAESADNQQKNIESFITQVNLGQKMVSKWFNRDKTTGSFNMELVKERGYYNASQAQQNIARNQIRGRAMLEDAGEELIKNTYLIINDISYTSKAGTTSLLKSFASVYTGNVKGIQRHLNEIGGFRVEVTSYLFRLKWNSEIADHFYMKYYTENGVTEQDKVRAFKDEKDLFQMEFVGKTNCKSSETKFSGVNDPDKLLIKVCTRALDQNIAQLQHSFAEFRIKAPLISTEPLKAYVGMKEDINMDSRFEVLERIIDQEGKLSYQRIGIIKPKQGQIWDNRFMASEEGTESANLKATEFTLVSGENFYPGMLIREIK
jgi:hypothetical protein